MHERSSKKQRELLTFVDNFIQSHGYGPSYREVMRALGYKSVSTVAMHIDGLIEKGYLNKRDNSARSLEVLTTHFSSDTSKLGKYRSSGVEYDRWLREKIEDRFSKLEEAGNSQDNLDEIYVLIGSMKILGFEESYGQMKQKLEKYLVKARKIT